MTGLDANYGRAEQVKMNWSKRTPGFKDDYDDVKETKATLNKVYRSLLQVMFCTPTTRLCM